MKRPRAVAGVSQWWPEESRVGEDADIQRALNAADILYVEDGDFVGVMVPRPGRVGRSHA